MLASSQWVWLIISHQMVQISLLPPLTSSLASLKSLSPIFTLFSPLKCSGSPVCFCDWWRCRVSCSNYLVFSDIKDVQLRDQFSSLIFITKCCFNKNSRLPTRCCCSTLLWPSVGNISALPSYFSSSFCLPSLQLSSLDYTEPTKTRWSHLIFSSLSLI